MSATGFAGLREAVASRAKVLSVVGLYPHFEYPQFKQVWQPSISTSAWVLHFVQNVAPGGKPEALSELLVAGVAFTSEFFFALADS